MWTPRPDWFGGTARASGGRVFRAPGVAVNASQARRREGAATSGTNPEDATLISPRVGGPEHPEVAVAAPVYGVRSARSTARATSTRDATPSLRKVLRRWVSTVFELRKSSAAI